MEALTAAMPSSAVFNFQQYLINAATIDERLGCGYQSRRGQKDSTDRAALRLAAWCRSAASGDWSLFFKRIKRDGLSIDQVLSRFADVEPSSNTLQPTWFIDSQWILPALTSESSAPHLFLDTREQTLPFETLFYALIEQAEEKLIGQTPPSSLNLFSDEARQSLRRGVLKTLTELYAPLLYSKFIAFLKNHSADGKLAASSPSMGCEQFARFTASLKTTGLIAILTEKPVLLRLTAIVIRQWIDTTAELMVRLEADSEKIRSLITRSSPDAKVHRVITALSDFHNFGRSVQVVTFDDQTRVVYKPKDLRLDVAWFDLISSFNASAPPVALKPVRAIASRGYGWTELIDHTSCQTPEDFELFYQRAGAWLALFHLFASCDMHFENILAHGSHPVPIDLEMLLQASSPEAEQESPETAAVNEANREIINSVLTVGLLPSYAKNPNNKIFDASGLNAVSDNGLIGAWKNINTDGMRWTQLPAQSAQWPNLPHLNGQYARFGDHLPAFISGFEQYAQFLLEQRDARGVTELLKSFANLPVRKVIRNTRFYDMLLQRLKDFRNMGDGITWSAHADFTARLANWDAKEDLLWPLQAAERIALLDLNVPHFVSPSDEDVVAAITGQQVHTGAINGLSRATDRFVQWSSLEIQRQIEIIKVSTIFLSPSTHESEGQYLFQRKLSGSIPKLPQAALEAEASRIATTIAKRATLKGSSAAWIGLDWLGDSEVGQLVPLGSDLYNGTSGIALFLAAYAHHTNDPAFRSLSLKALAATRWQITQASAPRWARGLGIGGASGLGSVIYALTVISELVVEPSLLQDALTLSNLLSDELIEADRSLDVISGSAGAILSLLALYRRTRSKEVLDRAVSCAEHLLRQPRLGEIGKRTWIGLGMGESPLTGMSHGAAGFAYALSRLAIVTGRDDFSTAAQECVAFETSHYDSNKLNWPDFRPAKDQAGWPSQWCHGAIGIGLARLASVSHQQTMPNNFLKDIDCAIQNTTDNWPQHVDTLCCGTLGAIEFLSLAGKRLNEPTLGQLSDRRLAEVISTRDERGDYKWNAGVAQFNFGLFRGLSGVGYTVLRKLNSDLPNVLIWE